MYKFTLSLLCLVALSGCSSHDVQFSTSPAGLEDCGDATPSSAVVVSWDAHLTKKKGIKIWVSNEKAPSRPGIWGADQNGTLWMGGGLVGSATTGQWIRPGTHLTLTDDADNDNDTLAKITIPSLPCKKSAG